MGFVIYVGISGLWGPVCKSSMTAKENCALRCLSPTCYELIYEGDPVYLDLLAGSYFGLILLLLI